MDSKQDTDVLHLKSKPTNSLRIYHEVISDLAVRYSPEEPDILDVGCGWGDVSRLLANAIPNASLTICDAYDACLENTKKNVNVTAAFKIDEDTFDIKNAITQQFDTVIMSHVLEHMRNPIKALSDVLDLVRPGGHLILAVPNPSRPEVFLSNILRKHYVNRGHVVAWDRSHWMNFLENIMSLNVVEYTSDTVNFLPGRPGQLFQRFPGRMLARAFPWLAFSNISVVRVG